MYTISFLFFNIKSKIISWIIIGGQRDEIVFFLVASGIAINLIFLLFILFKLIVYALSEINTTTATYCGTSNKQRTIAYQGPLLWNSLANEIRYSPSLFVFKKKIKSFILEK